MKNIVLLCAQGMSTGMLMNKMREAAKKDGYECTIAAYPVAQAKAVAANADCLLIGPQVRYEKDSVAEQCPGVPVDCVPPANSEEFCRGLLGRFDPTHVVAIERPGKGRDGHFHNSRGEIIDGMIADTDPLLRGGKAVSVAIGDGGNELGMGALRPYIEAGVPFGRLICADLPADYTLVSGVSNWWGWGVAALLSLRLGRDLLPADDREARLLDAVVRAGGVDGVTRRRECTVDSLTLEQNLEILRGLRDAAAQSGEATS